MSKQQPEGLIVLLDDRRNFRPGYRDGAVVLRSVAQAEDFFETIRASEESVAELWLDFVLAHGESTDEALRTVPGYLIQRAIFHSSAWMAHDLVEHALKKRGFSGRLEHLWDAFTDAKPFV